MIGEEFVRLISVAPIAGAWIETFKRRLYFTPRLVAPIAGAWIETGFSALPAPDGVSRPHRGGVD